MFSWRGTEGFKGFLFRNGWFECFSVQELKVPMVKYLEMGVSHFFSVQELRVPMVKYLEMGVSHVFSVQELKVPMVKYLEMGVSHVFFCLGTEGSNG